MAGEMNLIGSTLHSVAMVRGAPIKISGGVDIVSSSIWRA
ncbi:MAG: hypothetical protein ACI9UA_006219, partial [Pseudoalteromonas tetraodonis]